MSLMLRASALVLLSLVLTRAEVSGDVIDRSASGFTVKTTVAVAAGPQRLYQDLLSPGSWWDKDHTYSGDAKNMTLVAQPGGCFCEKLPGGGAVEHGRVVNVSPNQMIRLSSALGPLQELAVTGTMTWSIEPAKQGSGSTLTMTYAAAGYAPGGLDKLAPTVDTVLGTQVNRLKRLIDSGRPD